MNEKLKITLKGSVNILPLLIPVVPFGIILGAIGIELGFSVLETFATPFLFNNIFKILDFPTLDLPINAISNNF